MILGIDATRANKLQRTGVEEYAFTVIQEFKKIIPHSTKVVLYTDKPLVGELSVLPENWEEKILNWPPKRFWTQIRLSFEMILNPPNVLFVPAHVFPIIHPKKTVMTVHDIAAKNFKESFSWFERWYSLWSAKTAVKKLWKVIVPSEFVKNELIKEFKIKNSADIVVIYLGVNEKYFISNGEDEKITKTLEKYSIKKPYILSVSRIEKKKNTARIIEAFDFLKHNVEAKELQLVLAGKNGYGYEEVLAVAEKSEFKNDILFTGWVDENDLPYIFKGAEVFVFPSQSEGFGLPVLEAFACQIPVVISKNNSLEEIARGAALAADQDSAQDIANAINLFLTDKIMSQNKIVSGLEIAKSFSWSKTAVETWRLLSS